MNWTGQDFDWDFYESVLEHLTNDQLQMECEQPGAGLYDAELEPDTVWIDLTHGDMRSFRVCDRIHDMPEQRTLGPFGRKRLKVFGHDDISPSFD